MKIELVILNKEFYRTNYDTNVNYSGKPEIPNYATAGSAGVDLRATNDVVIYPGETVAIPTGLAIHIGSEKRGKSLVLGKEAVESVSFMGMIVPRSGLGTKGLVLANTVGVIDEDYQGEIIIQAWNRNKTTYSLCTGGSESEPLIEIKAGDRIAQLLFVPIVKAQWTVVEEFSKSTERGAGGFGSTGE